MADDLRYRVSIDTDPLEAGDLIDTEAMDALIDLNRQIIRTQEELKELKKWLDEGAIGFFEYSERVTETKTRLKELSSEYALAQRSLVAYRQGNQQALRTYEDVRKRMASISVELRRYTDLADRTKLDKLRAEYRQLNDQLKDFDAQMGNYQRNVGNYAGSLGTISNVLATIQGPLGPLAGRLSSLNTVLNKLGGKGGSATAAGAALRGVAIGAAGLVAVPIAGFFVALSDYLTKTKDGMQLVARESAALGARWMQLKRNAENLMETDIGTWLGNVSSKLNEWGNAADQWFRSFNESALDFLGRMETLMERSTNWMDRLLLPVVSALKGMGQVATGLSEGLGQAGDEARALSDALYEVVKAERAANLERAKSEIAIQRARDAAKDLNLTYDERIAQIKTAQALEQSAIASQIAIEQRRLALQRENLRNRTDQAKAEDEIYETQLRIYRLQADASRENMEAQTEINTLYQQQLELQAKIATTQQALAKSQRDLALNRSVFEIETNEGELEAAIERRKALIFPAEEEISARVADLVRQRWDAVEARRQALSEAIQRYNEEDFKQFVAIANLTEQRARATEQVLLDIAEQNINLTTTKRVSALRRAGLEEQAILAELETANANSLARRAALEQQYIDSGIARDVAAAKAKQAVELEIAQQTADAENAIYQVRTQNYLSMVGSISTIAKSAIGTLFAENKAASVATAIIDTLAGALSAAKSTPGGPIVKGLAIAAVVAQGMATVRKILATNIGSTNISAPATQGNSGPMVFSAAEVLGGGSYRSRPPSINEASLTPARVAPEPVYVQANLDQRGMALAVRRGERTLKSEQISFVQ